MNLKMYKACQKVCCEEFPNFLTSAESYCTGEVVGNLEKNYCKNSVHFNCHFPGEPGLADVY